MSTSKYNAKNAANWNMFDMLQLFTFRLARATNKWSVLVSEDFRDILSLFPKKRWIIFLDAIVLLLGLAVLINKATIVLLLGLAVLINKASIVLLLGLAVLLPLYYYWDLQSCFHCTQLIINQTESLHKVTLSQLLAVHSGFCN